MTLQMKCSVAVLLAAIGALAGAPPAEAQTSKKHSVPAATQPAPTPAAAEIDRAADAALRNLVASTPMAKQLQSQAKAVLVFPSIVKGGLVLGAQYGKGALRKSGKPAGYYETVAASYGLQAGMQKFGYALFFMNDASLAYLDRSDGWEIGVGPSVVVVDSGMGKTLTSTTLTNDVYAFIFNQKGLMAGLGVQGSKINRITP